MKVRITVWYTTRMIEGLTKMVKGKIIMARLMIIRRRRRRRRSRLIWKRLKRYNLI